MSLKNIFRKAAELVVELPPDGGDSSASSFDAELAASASIPTTPSAATAPSRTVAQVVEAAPGPNLDEIKTPEPVVQQPPIDADGNPDFPSIYSQSGVPAVAFGAEEALSVMGSLPAELPMDVKRKTVGATLGAMGKSMGVNTDSVVADASRKIAALNSFTEQLTGQTNQYSTMVSQKIAELNAQIADLEKRSQDAKDKLAKVVSLCEAEGHRLDDVLEFFTLDSPPSKHA